jgi:hypothetical protein
MSMAGKLQPVKTWGFQDVNSLVELGVPISRIAKQFGKSRQAVYDLLEKGGAVPPQNTPRIVNPTTAQGYEATSNLTQSTTTPGGGI